MNHKPNSVLSTITVLGLVCVIAMCMGFALLPWYDLYGISNTALSQMHFGGNTVDTSDLFVPCGIALASIGVILSLVSHDRRGRAFMVAGGAFSLAYTL